MSDGGKIEDLIAERDALRGALTKANSQAEHFEREWYLRGDEVESLQGLVRWAYSKLHGQTFSSMDDALKLDEMKLLLEHGI